MATRFAMLIEAWSEEARKAAAETRRKNASKNRFGGQFGAIHKKNADDTTAVTRRTTIMYDNPRDEQGKKDELAKMSKANKFKMYSDYKQKDVSRAEFIRTRNDNAVKRKLGVEKTARGDKPIGWNPHIGFGTADGVSQVAAGIGTKAISGQRGGAMAAGAVNQERRKSNTNVYTRDGNQYGGQQNTYDTHMGQLGPRKRAKGSKKTGILNTLKKALMKSPRKVDLTKSTDK